jgi:hypothetical protein
MLKLLTAKISQTDLADLCRAHFETMVKFVVDVENGSMVAGGEMHADAEIVLLENGSLQSNLWGGNFYPWNSAEERIEFTSFINIRPADDNASMEILNQDIRRQVRILVETVLLAKDEKMEIERP